MQNISRIQFLSLTAISLCLFSFLLDVCIPNPSFSMNLNHETPLPSGGSLMLHDATTKENLGPITSQFPIPLTVDSSFEGFNFDDNATETGFLFIPPDPIGAAGTSSLIAVVNVMIESRDKATGALSWRDSLQDFFSAVSPINALFDPKVVFDHYENRFVVIALEKNDTGINPDPTNSSRILVAVSKTATPASATASDWYYLSINSKELTGGLDHWADYPGFEIDEEAVYVTANMFAHATNAYSGVRLWIIDKGVTGGFYGGGSASFTRHDPYAGAGTATTTMPAYIYGASGAGSGIGTYLVSYDGLVIGTDEYIQVVRIDDPLGTPGFTQAYILLGDIENNPLPEIPDAPQPGTATLIEVNDRRALDAVWRNNQLWLTTTLVPKSGIDNGQATAHWIKLNTSSWPPSLADQGDIGGEDIATGTSTFFPAVAVNNAGDAYFGFSASSSTTYAGVYSAGRKNGDPAGTVRSAETVRAGDDYYIRTFGGGLRNRWGDYSGASLDPVDDNVFWIYNTYAMSRGTPTTTPDEDGRWGTMWGKLAFQASEKDFPWTMFLPAITSATPVQPQTYWGAISTLFCPSSALTFSLSSSGITKKSICQAGGCAGGAGTFEGWVTTNPGLKAFSWRLSASTCGVWTGGFSYTLVDGKNYLFSMEFNASDQPAVFVYTNTGKPQGASFEVSVLKEAEEHDQFNSMWNLVDEIPLDVPKGIFANSQKRLILIDKYNQ